jgi:AmmeMemoRadiSam system protein B
MNIRQPLRAGSFYEGSPSSCRHHAEKLLDSVPPPENLPEKLYGGLVPHAGWMYSGRLAAETLKVLDSDRALGTVVLLGSDHTGSAARGEVYDSGVWRTPLGEAAIDDELAAALLSADDRLRANPRAHDYEHSLEVQVPLIQVLRAEARIVPITIPPSDEATDIGGAIGRTLAETAPDARVVGSTDLTHHGGHFGAPGGRGREGVDWTIANDRRLLDLIEQMAADKIVPEVAQRGNACGPGAIAATIAACRELGAARGMTLEYTNSYEVIHAIYPDERDDTTVGYASVVFG